MMCIPSVSRTSERRVFAESVDPDVLYIDPVSPAPVGKAPAIRWMPLPDAAYLAGEVRFGPGADDFDAKPGLTRRLLPVPWEIGQVHAWYREGDRPRIVARGKTSGFGASNAVFSGTAPLAAMTSPVVVSCELECDAELGRGSTRQPFRVRGGGEIGGLRDSLQAELTTGAAWDATVAGQLIRFLTRALEASVVSLHIDGDGVEAEELREAALLEWAHRILRSLAPGETLGCPASLIPDTRPGAPPDLGLDWHLGARLKFRAVKSLQTTA
jgi:hypothetical protein